MSGRELVDGDLDILDLPGDISVELVVDGDSLRLSGSLDGLLALDVGFDVIEHTEDGVNK